MNLCPAYNRTLTFNWISSANLAIFLKQNTQIDFVGQTCKENVRKATYNSSSKLLSFTPHHHDFCQNIFSFRLTLHFAIYTNPIIRAHIYNQSVPKCIRYAPTTHDLCSNMPCCFTMESGGGRRRRLSFVRTFRIYAAL